MLCRKVIRSVLKTSTLRLDVRIVCQFRGMDSIKIRSASTVPVAPRTQQQQQQKQLLQQTQQQPQQSQQQMPQDSTIELHKNGTRACITQTQTPTPTQTQIPPQSPSQTQPTLQVNDHVSFEDLVFYPHGRQHLKNQDKLSIARDNAAYNECIAELTKMQPNDQSIRISILSGTSTSIPDTIKYLERSGLPLATVEEKLSIIHVAGTKGKGSTCALIESILRQYGARTGFFSSPHLVSTNERIRIDGDPLAKDKFGLYFWQVYNRLVEHRENEKDMPSFFMFLTIMAFHVFIAEKVDVVVLEVGLGGENDCTNVVRNVKTIGITSLALEHTALLGSTLKDIAWQKAGVIKPGSNVYTHVQQPECLKVIFDRVEEKKATITQVLNTEAYFNYNFYTDYLDSCNDFVRLNGALAIQLAYDWLRKTTGPLHQDNASNEATMTPQVLRGLTQAHWPGRCQLVEYRNMRVHLDGAHTVESMQVCCDWFLKSTKLSDGNPKILIFNRTGDSDPTVILKVLHELCNFDMICFVPNLANSQKGDPDQVSLYCTADKQRMRVKGIAAIWDTICLSTDRNNLGQYYGTLMDAFVAIRTRYPNHIKLDVLITGSLHLLGAAISALNEFQSVVVRTAH